MPIPYVNNNNSINVISKIKRQLLFPIFVVQYSGFKTKINKLTKKRVLMLKN